MQLRCPGLLPMWRRISQMRPRLSDAAYATTTTDCAHREWDEIDTSQSTGNAKAAGRDRQQRLHPTSSCCRSPSARPQSGQRHPYSDFNRCYSPNTSLEDTYRQKQRCEDRMGQTKTQNKKRTNTQENTSDTAQPTYSPSG